MKRKLDTSKVQLSFPIDSQEMITWDDKGNIQVVAVKNQYDPARDKAVVEQKPKAVA